WYRLSPTKQRSPLRNVRLFDEIQDKSRQLQLASEHKSQFISSMSHELRTPLNAIIGLTDMLVSNAARFGTEKALEPLQRVHRAGTHLLGLINQVLDLSKIEAGKLELSPQTVQLEPLINEVIGTVGQLAEQNKNRLVVDAQENLGALTVDPMRLRQIRAAGRASDRTGASLSDAAGAHHRRLSSRRQIRHSRRSDGSVALGTPLRIGGSGVRIPPSAPVLAPPRSSRVQPRPRGEYQELAN